jgi:hypothetical protein
MQKTNVSSNPRRLLGPPNLLLRLAHPHRPHRHSHGPRRHLLVVAIFFVLYALSSQNEAKPDLYDEFLQKTESNRRFGAGEKQSAPFHDKHIVCSKNAASPPIHDNNLIVSTITKRTVHAVSEKSSPEIRWEMVRPSDEPTSRSLCWRRGSITKSLYD